MHRILRTRSQNPLLVLLSRRHVQSRYIWPNYRWQSVLNLPWQLQTWQVIWCNIRISVYI